LQLFGFFPLMRCFRLLPFVAFAISSAFGQDYAAALADAQARADAREYSLAVAKFEAAFKLRTPRPSDLYHGACAAAQAGKSELALEWLQQAVDQGWANPQSTQSNPALQSLHELPRWKEILAAMRERRKALDANIDRPLRAQLRAIHDEDQKYRLQLGAVAKTSGPDSTQVRDLWKIIEQKDAENVAKVTAILDTRGWLGPDIVGPDGASALFLVIQHADLTTQEKYLPMLRAAVKAKQAYPSDLAMLEDRVLMGHGAPQIYGSQLLANRKSGHDELWSIADPDHVDERRASVGLPPLAEYLKQWNLTWDVAEHKRQHPPTEKLEREAP
jgi:hypothetical protein